MEGLLIFLMVMAILLYIQFPHTEGKDCNWMKGYCAHRGLFDKAQGIEENSPSAFQRAVDAGLNIEMDVRITQDRELIVFHDANGHRMLGVDQAIESMTLEEIRRYPLINTNEHVMTLREFLTMVNGSVGLIIEIKATSDNQLTARLCAEVLDQYTGRYAICSFRPEIIRWYNIHRPQVIRGQLIENMLGSHTHTPIIRLLQSFNGFAMLTKPNYLSVEYRHAKFFRWIRAFGGILCVWTIRDQTWMDRKPHPADTVIFENVKI